jgi:hypothetical protein
MRRSDPYVASGLVAVTLIISWGLAAIAGTTNVPRTDDWGFARVAFDLHRTGHLHLINWGPMTIVGHLVWAQPFLWVFGDHRWALSVSTSVLVAAGIVAAYRLTRLRLGIVGAAATVVVLLSVPGVIRDAATYMSDPTALSLQLITLAFGGAALRANGRRRMALIGVALLVGFWAFSIRELAAAAPLAVLAVAFLTDHIRRARLQIAAAGAVFALACLALWLWHHHLFGVEQYTGRPTLSASAILIVSSILTTAIAVAPALSLSLPRWWHARHVTARLIGGAVGVGIVATRPLLAWHTHTHNWWLIGDYLQADGINGGKLLLGYRPIVINDALWHLLIGIAAISTVLCAALIAEWIVGWVSTDARARRGAVDPVARLLGWHAALTTLVLVVAAFWNGALFDRYLWPLVFSTSFLLLSRDAGDERALVPSRTLPISQVVGSCVLVIAMWTTALLTLNSAAFDAARWKAASASANDGIVANEIDGGFEWDGAHSNVPNNNHGVGINDPLIAWWTSLTGMKRVCVVVTASPITSNLGREIRTVHWRPELFFGSATLHVYALGPPACP